MPLAYNIIIAYLGSTTTCNFVTSTATSSNISRFMYSRRRRICFEETIVVLYAWWRSKFELEQVIWVALHKIRFFVKSIVIGINLFTLFTIHGACKFLIYKFLGTLILIIHNTMTVSLKLVYNHYKVSNRFSLGRNTFTRGTQLSYYTQGASALKRLRERLLWNLYQLHKK